MLCTWIAINMYLFSVFQILLIIHFFNRTVPIVNNWHCQPRKTHTYDFKTLRVNSSADEQTGLLWSCTHWRQQLFLEGPIGNAPAGPPRWQHSHRLPCMGKCAGLKLQPTMRLRGQRGPDISGRPEQMQSTRRPLSATSSAEPATNPSDCGLSCTSCPTPHSLLDAPVMATLTSFFLIFF